MYLWTWVDRIVQRSEAVDATDFVRCRDTVHSRAAPWCLFRFISRRVHALPSGERCTLRVARLLLFKQPRPFT